MPHLLVEVVLSESNWLFAAILFSIIVVIVSRWRTRGGRVPERSRILWAMNLYYGCVIGVMGAGHLIAVTVRMVQDTVQGSWLVLYPLGLMLAVPASWLAVRAAKYTMGGPRHRIRMIALNAWLGLALLALGLHNLPLAAPAALNVAYQLHTRRIVGWSIVTVAVGANLALLAGSLVFLASGQTFEQFGGVE